MNWAYIVYMTEFVFRTTKRKVAFYVIKCNFVRNIANVKDCYTLFAIVGHDEHRTTLSLPFSRKITPWGTDRRNLHIEKRRISPGENCLCASECRSATAATILITRRKMKSLATEIRPNSGPDRSKITNVWESNEFHVGKESHPDGRIQDAASSFLRFLSP